MKQSRTIPRPEFPAMNAGLIPFGLVFLFVGLLPLSLDIPWWNELAVRSWQSTQGTITQCDQDQLLYTYQWEGRQYLQNTHSPNDEEPMNPRKLLFVQAHKVGDQVPVFVNPKDPGEALIEPHSDWSGSDLGFDLIFVVIFGGVGLLTAWMGARSILEYRRKLVAYFGARRT